MENENIIEITLSTERFLLEPITENHAQLLFDCLQSEGLYTFIPLEAPKTCIDLENKYRRWSARQSSDQSEIWLNYAICDKNTKEYLGTLQATIELKGMTYVAYEVFPRYWRRGIAHETMSVLISHIFINYKSEVITAHLDTRNLPSLKLLESLGFKYESTIKDADHFKGETSDEYVYNISKKDWLR